MSIVEGFDAGLAGLTPWPVTYRPVLRSDNPFESSVVGGRSFAELNVSKREKLAAITDSPIGREYHRAYYYDYKGRVIQTVQCDAAGNIHRTSSKYDLAGNLLAQRESYRHGAKTDVLNRTFTYDSRHRLLKETARFNNGEQAVVNHTYDNLGQLTGKTYGKGLHAIHETMDYNLQGG